MKQLAVAIAAGLVFTQAACSKKTSTDKTDTKSLHSDQSARPGKNTVSCKTFCGQLNKCADKISDTLVADLPEGPRKLFKGKLMARYKDPERCTKDCERAQKLNPGQGGALDKCGTKPNCAALAACLQELSKQRRAKITSARKDKELKVEGARKASDLPRPMGPKARPAGSGARPGPASTSRPPARPQAR